VTDFVTKEKRSKIMRAVRAKGNKTTELAMIKVFKENKITGWRRNYKLEGKPDFVFTKARLVVFVDGCYWHGHKCQKPRDSQKEGFWKEKMAYNKKHDRLITKKLRENNWVVIRVWECEIANKKYGRKLRLIKKQIQRFEVSHRSARS
jgi:DNA mismatch endonuclease (patch repair protein)